MVLALGPGVLDQRADVKPLAVGEDGPRNLDCLIGCQHADDPARRVGQLRDPAAELRAGGAFDIFQKLAHHGIEQRDLIFRDVPDFRTKRSVTLRSTSARRARSLLAKASSI